SPTVGHGTPPEQGLVGMYSGQTGLLRTAPRRLGAAAFLSGSENRSWVCVDSDAAPPAQGRGPPPRTSRSFQPGPDSVESPGRVAYPLSIRTTGTGSRALSTATGLHCHGTAPVHSPLLDGRKEGYAADDPTGTPGSPRRPGDP